MSYKPYEFAWPYCAKCGRGVEKVKRELDVFSGDVIYSVYCHGEVQTQQVSGLDLHDATLMHTTAAYDEKPTSAYPSVTYTRPN